MDYFSTRRRVAWWVALALAWPVTAHAEPLSYNLDSGSCQDTITFACDTDTCSTGGGGICTPLSGGGNACIPRDGLVCCGEAGDCPRPDGTAEPICTPISGLSGGSGICIQRGPEYCGSLTLEMIEACHTRPDGMLGAFAYGDCDGDGLSNGVEVEGGTDPCEPPPSRGILVGDGCVALPGACVFDAECTIDGDIAGTCEVTDDGTGTLCVPTMEAFQLYCGDPFDCLPDEHQVNSGAGVFCVPNLCPPGSVELLDCITNDEGARVPLADGDCDNDGTLNRDEASVADACGADLVDAGPGDADAGAPPVEDAGDVIGIDAGPGSVEDGGGPSVNPEFRGAGGCACRAATGAPASGGAASALALGLLGLITFRRRR